MRPPFAATTILAQPALAQQALDLGTLILSGGFTPIEAEQYGRSATVVTGEEIAERGITSVQDALRAVPGVAVNGSGGNFTQVRIRGGEGNHTLILIDGVEAAGGDGEYILSGLDTANIDRIEVLRGPQSVYYGSNASAGVINIITRTGGIGNTFSASARVGTHDSSEVSFFASTRTERGGLSFSLSDSRGGGWDFSGDGGERDGTHRKTLILKGDFQATESLLLGFNLRRSIEDYDTDSTNFAATDAQSYVVDDRTQFSKRNERTLTVLAEHAFANGRALQRLTYERTDNDQSYYGGAPTDTKGEALKYRLTVGLNGSAKDADQLVNFMLEREEDSSSSNPGYDRAANSIALEYRGSFASGLSLQAGVRHDNNSVFKDATTWSLGASCTFASGIRLHASAGEGVVNPGYFELYANAFGYTCNPNLQPERNLGFDIGVEVPFAQGRGTLDVTYFNEKLEDEITAVSTGPGTFSYINQAGKSRREGVEVEGRLKATDTIDLRMSCTYLDATNPNGSVADGPPSAVLTAELLARVFGITAWFRQTEKGPVYQSLEVIR